MRFISPVTQYRLIAVHQRTEPLADGTRRVISDGYTAHFTPTDVTDWEREEARRLLQFKGTKRYADGTPVDPILSISSFDTDNVHAIDCMCERGGPQTTASCVKLKAQVEQNMLRNDDFGKQSGYILVEKPRVDEPWPAYSEFGVHGQRKASHVAAENIKTAKATGIPLDALIAYERDNPRKGGEEIIAAYEAAAAEAQPTAPDVELVEA